MKAYIALSFLLLIGLVDANLITVCSSGCNFTSIQSAIDAAKAGDSVEVKSGTYHEKVYLSKALDLKGVDTGRGKPVVDAGGSGSAIVLYADGISLQGFNATNSGHCGCGNAGIKIMSNNSSILQNIVYKNKYGIYCSGYSGNILYQNSLVENEISAFDSGSNRWFNILPSWEDILNFIPGQIGIGNHYSCFDQLEEGCRDENSDSICDNQYSISGGLNADLYPLAGAFELQNTT